LTARTRGGDAILGARKKIGKTLDCAKPANLDLFGLLIYQWVRDCENFNSKLLLGRAYGISRLCARNIWKCGFSGISTQPDAQYPLSAIVMSFPQSAAEKLQCPEIVSLNQKRSGGFFRFEGSRNRSKRSVVVASSPTGAKTA
jgi:hypothetical protein